MKHIQTKDILIGSNHVSLTFDKFLFELVYIFEIKTPIIINWTISILIKHEHSFESGSSSCIYYLLELPNWNNSSGIVSHLNEKHVKWSEAVLQFTSSHRQTFYWTNPTLDMIHPFTNLNNVSVVEMCFFSTYFRSCNNDTYERIIICTCSLHCLPETVSKEWWSVFYAGDYNR